VVEARGGEKLKVFISYSRKDSVAFADELVAGLELAGFAPFLDRHDIAAGEDWEARLGGLIAQSDTVVFVVSPEAVKSERCVWEVDRTIELSKRLLPIIFKPVPEHDIPEKLSRLQFVRFDSGPGFARPLSQLAAALRVDLQWIREHTRLGEIATRWDRRGRPESLLLRGDEIDAAKTWMAARSAAAPEITDAQRAFVTASEEAEAARLGKEREQLEAIRIAQEGTARQQRRAARLLWGVAALMVAMVGYLTWQS
jgi:TIR domain